MSEPDGARMLRPMHSPRTRSRRRARSGQTLLQVAVFISLVGVVIAVFVPTFLRHVSTSKISEASERLAELDRRVAAYYAVGRLAPDGRLERWCLPEAAGPTPEVPAADGIEVDFGAEETAGSATWRALGFAPEGPLRYSYSYRPMRAGCGIEVAPGERLYSITAQGDLDGDGQRSRFERRATVDGDGHVEPLGILDVQDRVE